MTGTHRFVTLYRTSDGTKLPLHIRRCDTFLCRLRGLTFRCSLHPDEGLLFVEPRASRMGTSIHMFFVFFPIAVVWLDDGDENGGDVEEQSLVVVDSQLAKPFRPYYAPQRAARYFLEGPPALLDWVHTEEQLLMRSGEV